MILVGNVNRILHVPNSILKGYFKSNVMEFVLWILIKYLWPGTFKVNNNTHCNEFYSIMNVYVMSKINIAGDTWEMVMIK